MFFNDSIFCCRVDTSGDELTLRYSWRPKSTLELHLAHMQLSETTASSTDADILGHHLLALPQELYDMIHEFTFLPPSGTTIPLTTFHKPHSILQVSRATRSSALKSYYENNVFEPSEASIVWRFTNSLPKDVREGVRRQVERSWEERIRGKCKGRWPPDPAFAFAWDFA